MKTCIDYHLPHEVVRANVVNVVNDVPLIRAWREYLGLTQADVAKRARITQAALSQLESSDAKPRKTTLEKLARALGLKVEQLRAPSFIHSGVVAGLRSGGRDPSLELRMTQKMDRDFIPLAKGDRGI